ncbi:SDR family NAD(P)-dependent oxidoreductase [Hydrogenimonas sp.]
MKKALVTGVSSGIGRALTELLLQKGWKVYGLARCSNPPFKHEGLRYISLDLAATERITPALEGLLAGENRLDLVVLNAGVLGEIREMVETPLYAIEAVMRVNVWANKVILDTLTARGIAMEQVVGISSGAAVNGSKGWGAYSLSKASLNMLLKLYARELEKTHVNAIAPGVVDTPMVRHITEKVDAERFPSAARLKSGPILPPQKAVERLFAAIEKAKSYESGSFLDVRSMDLED